MRGAGTMISRGSSILTKTLMAASLRLITLCTISAIARMTRSPSSWIIRIRKEKMQNWKQDLRSFINNYSSVFDALSVNNGNTIKLPLSNNYKYQEMINAAYITYTDKIGSIGYQVGLTRKSIPNSTATW